MKHARIEFDEQFLESEKNPKIIVIDIMSSVIAFLIALQFQKVMETSVEDVRKRLVAHEKYTLPESVSYLICAVIVTCILSAFLYGLYQIGEDEVDDDDNK